MKMSAFFLCMTKTQNSHLRANLVGTILLCVTTITLPKVRKQIARYLSLNENILPVQQEKSQFCVGLKSFEISELSPPLKRSADIDSGFTANSVAFPFR